MAKHDWFTYHLSVKTKDKSSSIVLYLLLLVKIFSVRPLSTNLQ